MNLSEKDEIEQVGNEWAPLFAKDDSAACDYMFAQPVCEKFLGTAGGEPPEVDRPSGFQESFADAAVERVEIKGHKAEAEFSNAEPVEFIQENAPASGFLGRLVHPRTVGWRSCGGPRSRRAAGVGRLDGQSRVHCFIRRPEIDYGGVRSRAQVGQAGAAQRAVGTVAKADVIAYLLERQEAEIVALRENVGILSVERL